VNDDFEQKYDATLEDPVQVWLFCRLCRCRVQVRTVPRPQLPFRCFCGNAGTFLQFDVFAQEDEVVRFAKTFEDLYQETKNLLREAEMPMPGTQVYKPGELKRLLAAEDARASALPDATTDEASDVGDGEAEGEARSKDAVRDLMAAVQDAPDILARHEAMNALGKYLFPRRKRSAELKRLCYQTCEAQAGSAREVIREASARFRQGKAQKLSFPLVKRLVALLTEDGKLEKALEAAQRAAALGIPGYDERVKKLRAKLER
jgi:hypothetical protein